MKTLNGNDSGLFVDDIDEGGYDVDDEREESSEHILDSLDMEQLEQLTLSPIESKKSNHNQTDNLDHKENEIDNQDNMEHKEMNAEDLELDEIIKNHEEKRRGHRRIIEHDIDPLADDSESDKNEIIEDDQHRQTEDSQRETQHDAIA